MVIDLKYRFCARLREIIWCSYSRRDPTESVHRWLCPLSVPHSSLIMLLIHTVCRLRVRALRSELQIAWRAQSSVRLQVSRVGVHRACGRRSHRKHRAGARLDLRVAGVTDEICVEPSRSALHLQLQQLLHGGALDCHATGKKHHAWSGEGMVVWPRLSNGGSGQDVIALSRKSGPEDVMVNSVP